jgi:hypothetical protein
MAAALSAVRLLGERGGAAVAESDHRGACDEQGEPEGSACSDAGVAPVEPVCRRRSGHDARVGQPPVGAIVGQQDEPEGIGSRSAPRTVVRAHGGLSGRRRSLWEVCAVVPEGRIVGQVGTRSEVHVAARQRVSGRVGLRGRRQDDGEDRREHRNCEPGVDVTLAHGFLLLPSTVHSVDARRMRATTQGSVGRLVRTG